MRLVLLRHCQSVGNRDGILQSNADFELSEKGFLQAQSIKQKFDEIGFRFDQVYCSPLKRTRQTADIVSGMELNTDTRLREINLGELNGLKIADAYKKYPDYFLHPRAITSELNKKFPGGESKMDVYVRAREFHDNIILNSNNSSILIVSHAWTTNCLFAAIFDTKPTGGYLFRYTNTTVGIIEYIDSFPALKYFGDFSGLQRDFITK